MGGSRYEAVPYSDDEKAIHDAGRPRARSHFFWLPFYAIATALLATIIVVTYLALYARQIGSLPTPCSKPPIRHEWRSMWPAEQQAYINAALCLQKTPSILTGKGTLYDDFVYVHHKAGSLSHQSASFLPWHRAFIHIYEKTLQQRCGYNGVLPYWNWELDWTAIDKSEIFNNVIGFGGDGNSTYELGPGDGWCVTDGPWANSQRVWFEGEEKPHCMGRRFLRARTLKEGSIEGEWFSPTRIGLLGRANDYQTFRSMMEGTVHNGLHWSIRGDFSSLTAANDPLFWSHHAQLDRLWYMWQEQNREQRVFEYWGLPEVTDWPSPDSWALDDMLEFAGLWEEIRVFDVMDTTSGHLCYKY